MHHGIVNINKQEKYQVVDNVITKAQQWLFFVVSTKMCVYFFSTAFYSMLLCLFAPL
jgi:hypothetical protein